MPSQFNPLASKLKGFINSQLSSEPPVITLPPLAQPIFRFQGFIAQKQEVICIKEKAFSLTGGDSDSFSITNTTGQPVFQVKGRHISLSGRKSVLDAQGNHLFDMYKEHLRLHTTFVAEIPNGPKFLSIKSAMKLLGSKAAGTFTTADGQEHIFTMTGNKWDTNANIVLGADGQGPVIAVISRKLLNPRELLAGAQTYHVTIAQGVDIAMTVALCVALDEKNNEK